MSDSDDDYVEYGTPLEPIEEDAVPRKKPVLLEDQVVTDAQGRRRFHGAFTGGFSAGFFNTVGSLEGWTPSSFKSSRSERMENKIQKPSDYMDDEDIGEFGIAPQVLRATDDFNHLKRSRGRGPRISDGPIPGEPVLKLLLEPVRETVGLRILRRMGWRPGQGVGPRVIPRVRKRVVGCEVPPELRSAGAGDAAAASSSEASSEEDEAAAAAGITFAPEDIPTFLVHPKTDTFGLGYQGLDRRPVLSSGGAAAPPRRVVLGGGRGGTVSVAGQAFGVGALEEDDEDIYAVEDMSQYDFALGGPASSRHKSTQPSAAQAGNTLEEMFSKALRVSVREHFPPPPLPKDFIPGQRKRKTRFDQPPPGSPAAAMAAAAAAKAAAAAPRARSADERAALMGAEDAVGASGEADNEDSRERQRLRAEALKLTASLAPAGPAAGAGAGGRFAPFAGHPEKQRRYEQFLVLRRAGEPGKLSYLQPLNMTEWERQREMTEFEQAARLFQPLSADMGERFVSASQSDDSTDPLTPVEKSLGATPEQRSAAKMKMFGRMTRVEESWQPCDLLCKRFNIAKPTVSGATVDSRSKKKASVFDFLKAAPHNAIQNKPSEGLRKTCSSISPKLDASTVPVAALKIEKDKIEEDTIPKMEEPPPPPPPPPPPAPPLKSPSQEPPLQLPPPANITDDISKEKGGIAQDLPFPEPAEKIDLFKAIFLSSSESENEEEKEEDKEQMKTDSEQIKATYAEFSHMVASAPAEVPEILTEPQKKSISATPARSGVFANLDLDALISQPKHVSVPTNQEKEEIQKTSVDFVSSSLDDSTYGPRLPSTLSSSAISKGRLLPSVVAPRKPSSPVTEWVESTSLHKKKKKKKEKEREKKHKDKKSKSSKHKKHKHSKR